MSAGKSKEKAGASGEAQAEASDDSVVGPLTDEVPAVGEAITYVPWDPERKKYTEIAAQITSLGEDFSVNLIAWFPHARAGRPVQGVPFRPQDYKDNPVSHWRYPEAPVQEDD